MKNNDLAATDATTEGGTFLYLKMIQIRTFDMATRIHASRTNIAASPSIQDKERTSHKCGKIPHT